MCSQELFDGIKFGLDLGMRFKQLDRQVLNLLIECRKFPKQKLPNVDGLWTDINCFYSDIQDVLDGEELDFQDRKTTLAGMLPELKNLKKRYMEMQFIVNRLPSVKKRTPRKRTMKAATEPAIVVEPASVNSTPSPEQDVPLNN
jgi:hypothetical protein